jgi:hypothetical protein
MQDINIEDVTPLLYKEVDLQKVYKQWCKDTKRNGAILIGGSIREFIKVIEDNYEIKKK